MSACTTCGWIVDSSTSGSDSAATRAPPKVLAIPSIGDCFDFTALRLCPACGDLFEHHHDRDQETGITDDSVRRLAAPLAVKLLVWGLKWPDVNPKTEMLAALAARIPPPTLEALSSSTFEDPLDLCRAELLGAAAGPLVPQLAAHLESELGARALAAAGAFDLLEEAARRGSRTALRALARSGPLQIAPALVEILTGTGEGMARREAAQGLGRLGAGRSELYAALTTVKDSVITDAARDALAQMGATELLLQALTHPSWSTRWAGAVGLGHAGKRTPEILEALERAVLTPGGPPISRTSAFEALLRLGQPRDRLEAVLAPGLTHDDEDLRRSSALCLERLRAR